MRISLIAAGFSFVVFTLCGANVKAQYISATQLNPQGLVSFAVAKNTSSALVSWRVKNESDSTTFGVEKSIDTGKTFQQIGTVQGNRSEIYSFADNQPATGQNQYRLKLQDVQGNSDYSNPLILLFQPMNFANNKVKLTGYDDYMDMSPVSKPPVPPVGE
ncbi:MAG TPA: hypothetical protein VGM63_22345 [Mucilaginibacter sp.]|jgi:hypothetical protein